MVMPGRGPVRSAATVNGILTAVVELLRYLGAYEVIDEVVAGRLSSPRRIRLLVGDAWGENAGRTVDARVLRQRATPPAPVTLAVDEQDAVRAACGNHRDRFLVELLAGTGLRVGEACGLRLEDLHFLPSSTLLGCAVPGAHVHVTRRDDNENGALAKSHRSRTVPISARVAVAYSAYRLERDRVPAATASDFVFVNLYREPLGSPRFGRRGGTTTRRRRARRPGGIAVQVRTSRHREGRCGSWSRLETGFACRRCRGRTARALSLR